MTIVSQIDTHSSPVKAYTGDAMTPEQRPDTPSANSAFNENLIHLKDVDSTNAYAMREIVNLGHHNVIIADRQTAGRGRLQRQWISDTPDNLYMSIVIKPDMPWRQIPLVNFTQYFSLCLCRVLSRYGVSPVIKWPNDVLVNEAKIAGILSETVFEGVQFLGMVLGAGVNLNSDPSASHQLDQAVTALKMQCGRSVLAIDFARELFNDYIDSYERFVRGGFAAIKNDFLSFFPFIGKNVVIKNSTVNGPVRVEDVSDFGELVIRDSNGTVKTIALGDMIWRP